MHNLQVIPSHYVMWEDYRNGLYQRRCDPAQIEEAVAVLERPDRFAAVLAEVAEEWPFAASQHLSDFCKNHQPWCGRLACNYETGATITETNEAWAFLNCAQRERANAVADSFTYAWRQTHLQGQMSWAL